MHDPAAPSSRWNTMPEGEFRAYLRDFIRANCPADLCHLGQRLPAARTRPYH